MMLRHLIACLLLAAGSLAGLAQPNASTWYHFGHEGEDRLRDMQLTLDGGFVAVGMTGNTATGAADIYLLKLDTNLNLEWSRTIGGPDIEWGTAIRQLSDSGYAIAGYTNDHAPGGYEGYLVRTDKLGNVLWHRTYGGNDWDFFYAMDVMPDGGFALCGKTWSNTAGSTDIYVVRTDHNGNLLWSDTYGGANAESAHGLAVTADTSIVLVGETESWGAGGKDGIMVAYDLNGQKRFSQTFGWAGDDFLHGLIERQNGNYLACGGTHAAGYTSLSPYILETYADGTTFWATEYGSSPNDNFMSVITELPNNNIVALGQTYAYGWANSEIPDMYAFITDPYGGYITSPPFGYKAEDEPGSLLPLPDNTFLLGGSTTGLGPGQFDISMVRVVQPYYDTVHFTTIVPDLNPQTITITSVASIPPAHQTLQIVGNGTVHAALTLPENSKRYTVSVIDLQGKQVARITENTSASITLNRFALTAGAYLIQVQSTKGARWHARWLKP